MYLMTKTKSDPASRYPPAASLNPYPVNQITDYKVSCSCLPDQSIHGSPVIFLPKTGITVRLVSILSIALQSFHTGAGQLYLCDSPVGPRVTMQTTRVRWQKAASFALFHHYLYLSLAHLGRETARGRPRGTRSRCARRVAVISLIISIPIHFQYYSRTKEQDDERERKKNGED